MVIAISKDGTVTAHEGRPYLHREPSPIRGEPSVLQCSGGLVGGYWGAWGGWRPSGWRSSLSVRTGTVGSLELPDDDGGGAGLDEAVGTEAPEGDRARRDRGDGADGGPHHVPGEGGVPQAGATAQKQRVAGQGHLFIVATRLRVSNSPTTIVSVALATWMRR